MCVQGTSPMLLPPRLRSRLATCCKWSTTRAPQVSRLWGHASIWHFAPQLKCIEMWQRKNMMKLAAHSFHQFPILWYSLPDRKHSAFAACSVDATMPIHSGCAANVHRLRSSWPFRNSVNVNSCKFGIESKVATCRVCHPAEPEQGTSQRTRSKRIFRAPRTRPSEWSCSVGNWANSGENGNMQSDPTSAQDGKPQHEFSSYYVSQGSWIHEVAECLDCTVFC